MTDDIAGHDAQQWKEHQWQQRGDGIRHRFGHPVDREKHDHVGTSRLLEGNRE